MHPDSQTDHVGSLRSQAWLGIADELLAAMGNLRRSGRRGSGSTVELGELTRAQLDLVRLVRHQPGTSVAEAASELGLAANTVSTLVGQLTRTGILRRQVDSTDHRVARLELDDEIASSVAATRDRRAQAMADALARLTDAEQEQVVKALPAMARLAAELDAEGSP